MIVVPSAAEMPHEETTGESMDFVGDRFLVTLTQAVGTGVQTRKSRRQWRGEGGGRGDCGY